MRIFVAEQAALKNALFPTRMGWMRRDSARKACAVIKSRDERTKFKLTAPRQVPKPRCVCS